MKVMGRLPFWGCMKSGLLKNKRQGRDGKSRKAFRKEASMGFAVGAFFLYEIKKLNPFGFSV